MSAFGFYFLLGSFFSRVLISLHEQPSYEFVVVKFEPTSSEEIMSRELSAKVEKVVLTKGVTETKQESTTLRLSDWR